MIDTDDDHKSYTQDVQTLLSQPCLDMPRNNIIIKEIREPKIYNSNYVVTETCGQNSNSVNRFFIQFVICCR